MNEQIKDGTEILIDGVPRVAYICDRQADCKNSELCGKECLMTLDVRHAINFKVLDDQHYIEKQKEG